MADSSSNIELAAEITSAYVSNNLFASATFPDCRRDSFGAGPHFKRRNCPCCDEAQTPAVPIKKSIANDTYLSRGRAKV